MVCSLFISSLAELPSVFADTSPARISAGESLLPWQERRWLLTHRQFSFGKLCDKPGAYLPRLICVIIEQKQGGRWQKSRRQLLLWPHTLAEKLRPWLIKRISQPFHTFRGERGVFPTCPWWSYHCVTDGLWSQCSPFAPILPFLYKVLCGCAF